MKNRLLILLFLSFSLFISCKRNSKEEPIHSKSLEDILLENALSTNDNSIEEVSIVFYEGKRGRHFRPESNFEFKLKKGNSYFKYSNFSKQNLLKKIEDSILLKENEKDKIDKFFKHENTLLKDVYGDTIGEKPVWKIFFINKEEKVFKFIDINGQPQNQGILGLKASCDFLFEKIRKENK